MIKRGFITVTLVLALFIANLFTPLGVNKVEAAEFDRIAGDTRYETAVNISKLGWKKAENIVLASGMNFPDALAGAPLSYALDAPILLVKKDTISQSTFNEIRRLKPKNIYLLGGTVAISNVVVNQLKKEGYNVIRVSVIRDIQLQKKLVNNLER